MTDEKRGEAMAGPITPTEARTGHAAEVPEAAYDAINSILRERAGSASIVISQDEAVRAILARMPGVARREVFERHWLDFEDAYSKAGWRVEYEKPGYNEDGEAFWTFSRKRSAR